MWKALWLCVFVSVFGLLWVSFFRDVVPEVNALRAELRSWSPKVLKKAEENRELMLEIKGLRSDARYAEKILRENLLLHRKDELIILIPDDWKNEGVGS
ncbi:MAG: septum formation initiator family protein [Candidatus Coatesbacteria bacterium]|nr:septum formation initiator family protein [Candidatus Coatesbacteria bacterium]